MATPQAGHQKGLACSAFEGRSGGRICGRGAIAMAGAPVFSQLISLVFKVRQL
jgi:hypothetical protein